MMMSFLELFVITKKLFRRVGRLAMINDILQYNKVFEVRFGVKSIPIR